MSKKNFKIAFQLGAKMDSSLRTAFSNANKNFSGMQKNMRRTNRNAGLLQRTFGSLSGVIKAAGVAAGAYFGVKTFSGIVKSATEFQDQMANVSTLLDGDIQKSLSNMSGEVKKLAIDTGVSTELLTDGLYEVISALGESDDSMKILETAAKGASAGNATVTESIKLLSAITKGYGDTSAEAAEKASDLAFLTLKLGQTSYPELAASMGSVIPLASTLKVEQEELFGAMATLTGVTGNTAEVTTQLRATLQGFLQPTNNMTNALSALGYKNGMAALESEGLEGILKKLKAQVGGNEIAFSELFSSVLAKNAVLSLTGAQAENLTEKTKAMYEAVGNTAEAFEKKQKTVKGSMGRIREIVNVASINIGEKILPKIADGLTFALEMFEKSQPYVASFNDKLSTLKSAVGIIGSGFKWLKDVGIESFNIIRDKIETNLPTVDNLKIKILTAAFHIKHGFENTRPIIEWLMTSALPKVVDVTADVLAKARDLYNFIVNNWHWIAPIVVGITASIVAFKTITLAQALAIKVVTGAQLAWTAATAAFGAVMAFITSPIGMVVIAIGGLIAIGWLLVSNWDSIKEWFGGLWLSFIVMVSPIGEKIASVFQYGYDAIIILFSGLGSFFDGVFNGVTGSFRAGINFLISLANSAINRLNSLSISVPDWVPGMGGNTFSLNIPNIPMLAKGGITTGPTLAMIGEGAEQEAVLPLSKLEALLNMPSGGSTYNDEQDFKIVYNPQIIIQGNADKETVHKAVDKGYSMFKRWLDRYFRERNRKKF